ncbi:MAG TPA: Gfo/Idh/MocA family oxidoreductase [Acidimicrobiia bacterium]|nr:Gfo/Idh/MocA family oxidoreductase [Acidimicrobiia bacterium]
MEKVGLALVGLGHWAGVLARAVTRGAAAEVVNCYSRNPETTSHFQEEHAIPRSSATLGELLSDPKVEGVLVTTPNDTHEGVILASLDAGKAVYTDKPIAHDLRSARRIEGAVNQSGLAFAVGHGARRLAGPRQMRALLEQGALGGVSIAEAHFTTRRGLSLGPDQWRYYADQSPGGPFIQLGVHHADTLQYLLGPVATVTAHSRRLFTPAEVPDTFLAVLEFESGALGYLGTGFAAPPLYQIRILGTDLSLHYEVDLRFWDQSEVVDAHSSLNRQGRGGKETVELKATDALREQVDEFALAIRGQATPEVGLDDAIKALAVIEAGLVSVGEGGRTVSLAELHRG